MADPTAEEVDAIVTLVDADISTAIREMIRLTRACLPSAITRWNSRRTWTIPAYNRFGMAPKDLTNEYVEQVLFKHERAPQTLKGQNRYRTDATVSIYVVGQRLGPNSIEQMSDCRRVGALVKAILATRANNHNTPDGLPAWNQITFGDLMDLPDGWRNYAGCTLPIMVMGWPGSNSWGVA